MSVQNMLTGRLKLMQLSSRQVLNITYTTIEAATYLAVSDRTIRRWCEEGKIPARGTNAGWLVCKMDLDVIKKIGISAYLASDENESLEENTISWQQALF